MKIEDLTEEEYKLIEELMKEERYEKLMKHLMNIEVNYHITQTTLNNIKKYVDDSINLANIMQRSDKEWVKKKNKL